MVVLVCFLYRPICFAVWEILPEHLCLFVGLSFCLPVVILLCNCMCYLYLSAFLVARHCAFHCDCCYSVYFTQLAKWIDWLNWLIELIGDRGRRMRTTCVRLLCSSALPGPGVKPAPCESQVRCSTRCASAPPQEHTRCSAIAERPRCRVRYSFRQK